MNIKKMLSLSKISCARSRARSSSAFLRFSWLSQCIKQKLVLVKIHAANVPIYIIALVFHPSLPRDESIPRLNVPYQEWRLAGQWSTDDQHHRATPRTASTRSLPFRNSSPRHSSHLPAPGDLLCLVKFRLSIARGGWCLSALKKRIDGAAYFKKGRDVPAGGEKTGGLGRREKTGFPFTYKLRCVCTSMAHLYPVAFHVGVEHLTSTSRVASLGFDRGWIDYYNNRLMTSQKRSIN